MCLYLVINPYLFPYRNGKQFGYIFIIVLVYAVFFPAIATLLMYANRFIKTLSMEDKMERVGPLIVCAICYLWLFLNIRTHNAFPLVFSAFVLGALISICIAFFLNNFHKISLHAIGISGFLFAVGRIIISEGRAYSIFHLPFEYTISVHNIFLLSILLIITGAVISSRLYLKAHTMQDVLGGVLVGLIGQILAIKFF